MTNENLTFYEPTEEQLAKFRWVNKASDYIHDMMCRHINDCSQCDAAIHQWLISTEKHICTRGISEKRFRTLMSSADCEY